MEQLYVEWQYSSQAEHSRTAGFSSCRVDYCKISSSKPWSYQSLRVPFRLLFDQGTPQQGSSNPFPATQRHYCQGCTSTFKGATIAHALHRAYRMLKVEAADCPPTSHQIFDGWSRIKKRSLLEGHSTKSTTLEASGTP